MYSKNTWDFILQQWLEDKTRTAQHTLGRALAIEQFFFVNPKRDEWVDALVDIACMLEQGINPS